MGKRPPPAKNLEDYARFASERLKSSRAQGVKPSIRSLDTSASSSTSGGSRPMDYSGGGGGGGRGGGDSGGGQRQIPLSEVVADCVRRWFQDTLKEARAGDTAMQVLVGQMYQSGYGIPRNEQKARAWLSKASKVRSSVWKVSGKQPGYNASDSDSVEEKDELKQ